MIKFLLIIEICKINFFLTYFTAIQVLIKLDTNKKIVVLGTFQF